MSTIVLPSGESIGFEFGAGDGNSGLFIGMKVYDDTGGSPSLITTVALTHVFGGSYRGSYTFSPAIKKYFIQISAYTDGTFTTILTIGSIAKYSPIQQTIRIDGFDQNFGRSI